LKGILLVSVLVLFVSLIMPLAYGEEFLLQFSENHSKFVKGELVGIIMYEIDPNRVKQVTGAILDNSGNQIESLVFDSNLFSDIGFQVWSIFPTDNSNFQPNVLYTVEVTYLGTIKQLQFTLAEPALTNEELTMMIGSQMSSTSEIDQLRQENSELRQQLTDKDKMILDLQNQIQKLTDEFMLTITQLNDWFRNQLFA